MLFYRNIFNNQQNTVKALAIATAKGIESGAVAGAGMMDAYLDSIMQTAKRKSQQVTNPTKNDPSQTDQAVNAHLLSSNISETELGLNEGYPSCSVKLVKLEYEGSGYSQAGALMQVQATLDADLQVTDQSQKYTNATFTIDEKDKFKASVETNIKNIFANLEITNCKKISNINFIVNTKTKLFDTQVNLEVVVTIPGKVTVIKGSSSINIHSKSKNGLVAIGSSKLELIIDINTTNRITPEPISNDLSSMSLMSLSLVTRFITNSNPVIAGIRLIGGVSSAY